MKVNDDILWRISEFLEPDLVMYVRLAAVNRAFYSVFTSDKLWKHFNPYNAEKHIFGSFQDALKSPLDQKLLRFYWVRGEPGLEPLTVAQLRSMADNRFIWLGYLCRNLPDLELFEDLPALVETAVYTVYRRPVYAVESPYLLKSKKWAIKLVKLKPELKKNFVDFREYSDVIEAALTGEITNYYCYPVLHCVFRNMDALNGPLGELAILKDPRNVEHVKDELHDKFTLNRDWVLQAAETYPGILRWAFEYQDDFEVVSAALRHAPKYPAGTYFSRVSERLRRDPDICRMAVAQSPNNIEECLVKDMNLLKHALKQGKRGGFFPGLGRLAWEIYGADLENDLEACILLAEGIGYPFPKYQFANTLFRNEDVLLSLLSARALSQLPKEFKENPEFVAKALPHVGPEVWRPYRISDEMRRDPRVGLAALKLGIQLEEIEKYTGPIFSSDREMVKLSAECTSYDTVFKIPEPFADDNEIVSIAVTRRGCALQYASERLRSDKAIALKALDTKAHLDAGGKTICVPFRFLSKQLQEDSEFLDKAVIMAGTCPGRYLQKDDTAQRALTVFRQSPHDYRGIPKALKRDLEFNILAAQASAGVLRFMDDDMASNERVLAAANFEYSPLTVTFCPDSI